MMDSSNPPEYRPTPRSVPSSILSETPKSFEIFGHKISGGGYSYSHDYSVKKNPFIEGMANYRDFLQYRFKLNTITIKRLSISLLIIPIFIGYMDYRSNYKQERIYNQVRKGLGIKVNYDEYYMRPLQLKVGNNDIQREQQQKKE